MTHRLALSKRGKKSSLVLQARPFPPVFFNMHVILMNLIRKFTCVFFAIYRHSIFFLILNFSALMAEIETLILHFIFSKYKDLTIMARIFCFIKSNRNQFLDLFFQCLREAFQNRVIFFQFAFENNIKCTRAVVKTSSSRHVLGLSQDSVDI